VRRNTARQAAAQATSPEDLAEKFIAAGHDPALVQGAIILIKRGAADIIADVLAGRLSIGQAVRSVRGRP
jgi:hypothetical protein